METMPQETPRKNNYTILLLIVITVIVLSSIIFGVYLLRKSTTAETSERSFFDSEIAMVLGLVTQIDDKKVTIENKDGIVQTFPFSPTFTIMTPNDQGVITPSNDISKIATGKKYSITLSLGPEGTLEITSVMPAVEPNQPVQPVVNPPAFTPAPSAPTTATRSAVTASEAPRNTDTEEE